MTPINIADRAVRYNTSEFGKKFPRSRFSIDRLSKDSSYISAIWRSGNDYRNANALYGAYPPAYWKRILFMFDDLPDKMNLFSGMIPKAEGFVNVDINPKHHADVFGNANDLVALLKKSGKRFNKKYDVVFADPPYLESDAKIYGYPMPNKKRVVEQCARIVKRGGYLIWLDQSLPMYRKTEWKEVGHIGVIRSTNHRFRIATIFQRV